MSETTTEATETGAEDTTQEQSEQLPNDHPLVKTLNAQKAELKELRPKARRLTELEQSQMTEGEKTAQRISDLEGEVASVPARVAEGLRSHLVELHKIDKDDAELFLTATEPELLLKQVTRLLDQSGKRRKNHVPREGENPNAAATSDVREFTRNLFNRGD